MSSHPHQRVVGWVLLALAGLAVAVALSVTASNLSTQPIGLSGEPLRAGERLAPVGATELPRQITTTTRSKRPATTTVKPAPRGAEGDDDRGGGGLDRDDD